MQGVLDDYKQTELDDGRQKWVDMGCTRVLPPLVDAQHRPFMYYGDHAKIPTRRLNILVYIKGCALGVEIIQ